MPDPPPASPPSSPPAPLPAPPPAPPAVPCTATSSPCSCWICRPISASRTNGKKCGQFKRAAAGRIYHENPIKSGQRSVWDGGRGGGDAEGSVSQTKRPAVAEENAPQHQAYTTKGTSDMAEMY